MTPTLKLVSHKLCPYVQRALIALTEKGTPFERIDVDLSNEPDWFKKVSPLGKTPVLLDGERFSLVDAVFGSVFRYFDALDRIADFGILAGLPKTAAWRAALAARPSIQSAVSPEYPALLWEFYRTRGSHLSRLIDAHTA